MPGLAEAVRLKILRGELREGDVIPQTELARELGVSPVPLREALHRLEVEGLVTFLPYRGTIVTPVTPGEVTEAFEGAIALGLVMLPKALARLTASDFQTLRALAERLDFGEAGLEDALDFYTLLLRPADMPLLLEFLRNVIFRSVRIFALTQVNRINLQRVSPTRMDMIAAFESGDEEAAKDLFRRYHHVRRDGLLRLVLERES